MNREEAEELKVYAETLPYVHHIGDIAGLGGANGECIQIEVFVTEVDDSIYMRFVDDIHKSLGNLKLWPQIIKHREVAKSIEKKDSPVQSAVTV